MLVLVGACIRHTFQHRVASFSFFFRPRIVSCIPFLSIASSPFFSFNTSILPFPLPLSSPPPPPPPPPSHQSCPRPPGTWTVSAPTSPHLTSERPLHKLFHCRRYLTGIFYPLPPWPATATLARRAALPTYRPRPPSSSSHNGSLVSCANKYPPFAPQPSSSSPTSEIAYPLHCSGFSSCPFDRPAGPLVASW